MKIAAGNGVGNCYMRVHNAPTPPADAPMTIMRFKANDELFAIDDHSIHLVRRARGKQAF